MKFRSPATRMPFSKNGGSRMASDKSPFLGMAQVLELIPMSRSNIYLMISAGEFPAPKHLGVKAVAWSKQEINDWISEKLQS